VQSLPSDTASYAENFDLAADYLLQNLTKGDVAIVFSAGDATQLSKSVLNCLQQRETAR
jgi:UDP-N-acetylmuramate-alanine ligase